MLPTLLIMTLVTTAGGSPAELRADSTPLPPEEDLRITIIYDNYAHDESMRTDWGFSALIEHGGERVLFDVGTRGEILLTNAAHLGLDLGGIAHLVLSHEHGDHTGGLTAFLEQLDGNVRPRCRVLPSFPGALKRAIEERCELIEAGTWQEIVENVWTTGEIEGVVNEQAVVVTLPRGLVVVTGCAHPGIAGIVRRAKERFGREVLHVIGGFHLAAESTARIEHIVQEFEVMEVERVTPTHCTGEEAIALFRSVYGDDYVPGGTGKVFVIPGR